MRNGTLKNSESAGSKHNTIQQNTFNRDNECRFVWLQLNNSISINKDTVTKIIKNYTDL